MSKTIKRINYSNKIQFKSAIKSVNLVTSCPAPSLLLNRQSIINHPKIIIMNSFIPNDPNHAIVSNRQQHTYFPVPLKEQETRTFRSLPPLKGLRKKAQKPSMPVEDLLNLPSISQTKGVSFTVCGSDNRVQVSDTTETPYDSVCYLLITMPDGSQYRGSGWFSGYGTVITAGHCVYDTDTNTWAQSIEVIPGRDGSYYPYGSQTSSDLHTSSAYVNNGDSNYDYAAVILPNTDMGKKVGTLGFGQFSDSTLESATFTVDGYPSDKDGHNQWYATGVPTSVSEYKVYYNIDTHGGDSGGPDWITYNDGLYVAAIHTHGGCPNYGNRITSGVFSNIQTWNGYGND